MLNARPVIVAAIALLAIGGATATSAAEPAKPATPAASAAATQTPPAAAAPTRPTGTEEVKFRGYRLVVHWGEAGKAPSAQAQAYDPAGKKVPTHVVPMREVSVCAPKSVDPAVGSGTQCEPFSFIPDGTSFKTGAHSICWYFKNGYLAYYWCP